MKYLKHLLVLTGAVIVFFSCQKEYSVENGTGTTTGSSQWQFKDSAGTLFKGPVDTAFIDTLANIKWLSIEGKSDDGRDMITLQVIMAEVKPGTYTSPSASFDYTRNGSLFYQSDVAAIGDFTIIVSAIDANGVTGTFSGKVKDGSGKIRSIKEGKFTARFKKGNDNPPTGSDSGQVMLWSKAGCGGGTSTTPIAVSVSNKSGQITSFTATEPANCGAAGAFTVKLPVGTYTWVAKCGVDSISSSVTVSKDVCTKVEVNFSAPPVGDYFPTTANSNWSYSYEGVSDTLNIQSTGVTKSYSGNQYFIFANTDGSTTDSSYYRKGGGIYYEYYPADLNAFPFDSPTAIEHVFLKDNLAAGSVWFASFPGTVSGIPITGYIRDTIYQKDVTATVGSTTYQNVIKVRTGYSVVLAPAPAQQLYWTEQWFARGKGLIKYIDFDPTSNSGSVMNVTRLQVY